MCSSQGCGSEDTAERNNAADITEAAKRGVRVAVATILDGKVSVRPAGLDVGLLSFRRPELPFGRSEEGIELDIPVIFRIEEDEDRATFTSRGGPATSKPCN